MAFLIQFDLIYHFTANLLEFMLIHVVSEHKHEMMKPSPINKKT